MCFGPGTTKLLSMHVNQGKSMHTCTHVRDVSVHSVVESSQSTQPLRVAIKGVSKHCYGLCTLVSGIWCAKCWLLRSPYQRGGPLLQTPMVFALATCCGSNFAPSLSPLHTVPSDTHKMLGKTQRLPCSRHAAGKKCICADALLCNRHITISHQIRPRLQAPASRAGLLWSCVRLTPLRAQSMTTSLLVVDLLGAL